MSSEPTIIDKRQAVYSGDWERPSFREMQEKIDRLQCDLLFVAVCFAVSFTLNLVVLALQFK